MYSGDITSRLQISESSVAPISAMTPIGSDPQSASAQRFAAVVLQRLANNTFDVLVGGRALRLVLPPQTEIGQQLSLCLAPGGNWSMAEPTVVTVAQVTQNLGGGKFSVLIGGRTLQIALPPDTKLGQMVQVRQSAGGEWVAAGSANAGVPTTQTEMSQTARLVDLVLQATPRGTPPADDGQPLLATTPAPEPGATAALPATLAKALASALSESGMFYESHLQQWSAGSRDLASIVREPQAALNLSAAPDALPGATAAVTPSQADFYPSAAAQANAIAASVVQAGVHPDAVPIIAQQLTTLDTGQLLWRGELWPGQSLHWDITRDDDAGDTPSGGERGYRETPKWRTRLAIDFPHLGAVTANLVIQGSSVHIVLDAAEPATLRQLNAAGPTLGNALANAGMNMQMLEFEHEPANHG